MKLGLKYLNSVACFDDILSRLFTIVAMTVVLFSISSSNSFSQDVIVYSNKEPVLARNALRTIYSMRLQTWPDGSEITVFILDPEGESHRKFCLEVLNIFPYQLQRIWDVLVFSGTGQAPVVVRTEQEMIRRVKATPGAIGYVIESEVPSDVKKISINY